jgi:tetratricopeptide (TPR) repeat protein
MRDQSEPARTVRPDPTGPAPAPSRLAEDRIGELAEAFLGRHRRGERPSVEEYAAAHPELAGEIRRLFPALLMMEDLQPESSDLTGGWAVTPGAAPERLGDFRILREVGRGGMGVVYEAEQESLGRRVALKVLAAQGVHHPKQLLRFHREARAAARLHHTNIVPVFGVGESEGQHYYVMQFIPGLGLDAVLDEVKRLRGPQPKPQALAPPAEGRAPAAAEVVRSLMTGQFPPAAAEDPSEERLAPGHAAPTVASGPPSSLVLPGQGPGSSATDSTGRYARSVALVGVQVAEALDYAHRQGTLHRDIKPSNLLLDGQGTVWVADFGLAKAADSDDLTHTGDIVGTLRYMAPERFEGRCDARSDIYALGLTLYELLARRPAFDKSDRAALIRQVTHEEPPRLRGLDPTIPRDLETVVHKAIEREPGRRYAEAADLAADLRRYVEGRPIRARRISPLEHAWRWGQRNPAAAALVAAVLALVGLSTGGGLWMQRHRAETALREGRQRAEAALREARARDALKALMDQAARLRQQGLWAEARALLARAEDQLNDAGARDLRRRLREARADLDLAARLESNAIGRTDRFRSKAHYGAVAAEYAAAFEASGLLAAGDEGLAADAIRRSAIHEQLVAALDDWALVTPDDGLRTRLLRLARRVDPDPAWRDRVRDPAVRGDRRALERLAGEVPGPPGAEPPPQLLHTLAVWFKEAGGDPEPLLRAAQQRRPWDFWLNLALASALREGNPGESLGFLRAALVTRPQSPEVYHILGDALRHQGRKGEALAAYRKATEFDPTGANPYDYLGLGNALQDLGRSEEAVAAYRRAIALDPKRARPYHGLGNALRSLGKPEEGVAAYRQAIALDPRLSGPHYSLGNALLSLGRGEEAAAAYRQAIASDAKLAPPYCGLGDALASLGKWEEAIAAYRRAIALDPKDGVAHYNLGVELEQRGHLDEAIAELRQATTLDGEHMRFAPFVLSQNLRGAGRYGEAADTLRRFRERVQDDPDRVKEVDGELALVERDAALAPRLTAVLRGEDHPVDAAERLGFARLASDRRLDSAATQLYAAALASDPTLADDRQAQHRYAAALAAARAAGRGTDNSPRDQADRAALRAQALGWLRAELAEWSKQLESGPPQGRPAVVQAIQVWKDETDLIGVRSRDALALLPAPERSVWQALWADVDALIRRASTGSAPSPDPPAGELPADLFAR